MRRDEADGTHEATPIRANGEHLVRLVCGCLGSEAFAVDQTAAYDCSPFCRDARNIVVEGAPHDLIAWGLFTRCSGAIGPTLLPPSAGGAIGIELAQLKPWRLCGRSGSGGRRPRTIRSAQKDDGSMPCGVLRPMGASRSQRRTTRRRKRPKPERPRTFALRVTGSTARGRFRFSRTPRLCVGAMASGSTTSSRTLAVDSPTWQRSLSTAGRLLPRARRARQPDGAILHRNGRQAWGSGRRPAGPRVRGLRRAARADEGASDLRPARRQPPSRTPRLHLARRIRFSRRRSL